MTPLPLTNFEELMFWEDRPAFPCNVFVRVRFTSRLDRADVEATLAEVVLRHPLLRSKIELHGNRWHWVLSEDQPAFVWNEMDELNDASLRATHIDLKNEIGLRVFVSVSSQASELVLQYHHACCDGAGINSFLHDLFLVYARKRGESEARSRLPEYDSQRLVDRARYGLTWWKLLKMLPRQLIGLHGAQKFVMRNPTPIVPHVARSPDASPPEPYPAVVGHRFTFDETIRLKQLAQVHSVTVNEVLARDLFRAIFQWRREQGFGTEHDWLRMMVPMDMRTVGDRELPAANVVSSIFLDRRNQDADNPDRLLASIHDEMQLIKRNQLGMTFLFSLRLFQWLPGGIRKSVRTDKCTISFIFTNIGKILVRTPLPKRNGRVVLGDTVVESIQGLVPLRPFNCAAFCAMHYGGQMAMDLHYDAGVLSEDHARRIMVLFVEHSLAAQSNHVPRDARPRAADDGELQGPHGSQRRSHKNFGVR